MKEEIVPFGEWRQGALWVDQSSKILFLTLQLSMDVLGHG